MSDQIIPQATWQPRWYYVMVNKTSGKKYVGQTVRENMDKYCGSGGYWKAHCKKHGGLDRLNVEVLEQIWVADKVQAQEWLDAFAVENGEYWLRSNTEWANVCKETTEDSPFAGNKEIQSKAGKIGGKIAGKKNVESGHWAKRCSAGGKTGGKINGKIQGKKNVESGQWKKCQIAGGKKNVDSGHLKRIASAGGKAAGKIAAESGQFKKCCSAGRKIRAENSLLRAQFCKVFGITSPGKNHINIDKAAFQAWKESMTQVSEIG
jgi:hypothetical protein